MAGVTIGAALAARVAGASGAEPIIQAAVNKAPAAATGRVGPTATSDTRRAVMAAAMNVLIGPRRPIAARVAAATVGGPDAKGEAFAAETGVAVATAVPHLAG